MTNIDPSKLAFSTLFRYLLNYNYNDPAADATLSVPSTSYAAGTVKSYSLTIPLTRQKDFSKARINFSQDPTKWYDFPMGDIQLDANFSISTIATYGPSLLTFTFYVVNQTGGTVSNTAFNVEAKAMLFVTPA